MDIMTQILCVLALIGLADKFFGNRWGYGADLHGSFCSCFGLGMSISFLLPIFFTMIPKRDFECVSKGFLYGVLTLPIGLIVSGLLQCLTEHWKHWVFWRTDS